MLTVVVVLVLRRLRSITAAVRAAAIVLGDVAALAARLRMGVTERTERH